LVIAEGFIFCSKFLTDRLNMSVLTIIKGNNLSSAIVTLYRGGNGNYTYSSTKSSAVNIDVKHKH
jgi:hypothetical protein